MHSHLIPKIDDGSQSTQETIEMLKYMHEMGLKKIITTPHIISDLYPNTPSNILNSFNLLKQEIVSENIPIEFEVSAEHYLDEFLMQSLDRDDILPFGGKYLLFETSFMSKPAVLEDFIFKVISKGLKPVMAHPERYIYFQNSWDLLTEILDRGTLFQINISSLSGFYSRQAKIIAQKLIDTGRVHFLGTDAHNIEHLKNCAIVMKDKYVQKALNLPLLNYGLL